MTERQRHDVRLVVATVIVSVCAMFIAGVTFTSVAIDRNNRAICGVMISSNIPLPDPPPAAPPSRPGDPGPSTEYGKLLQTYVQQVETYQKASRDRAERIRADRTRAIKQYECEESK